MHSLASYPGHTRRCGLGTRLCTHITAYKEVMSSGWSLSDLYFHWSVHSNKLWNGVARNSLHSNSLSPGQE